MFDIKDITPAAVQGAVMSFKRAGMSDQDIENMFKDALKVKYISIDVYYEAMRAIYGD